MDSVFCGGWYHHLCGAIPAAGGLDRRPQVSRKTRSQRNQEREQTFFIILTSLAIVAMVGLILYKAVNG
jgi:hypothetical protein